MLSQNIDVLLAKIHDQTLEKNLNLLATIGGTKKENGETAVTRLVLSKEDYRARQEILIPLMQKAGMTVKEHPFGLIGTHEGQDPTLPPIVLFSHFDSVPNGGMYDGDVGVIGAIEIIHLLHENNMQLLRTIIVIAFSGEEAARFNIAHIGSISMFRGLTDNDLNTKKAGDLSIREALHDEKLIETAKKPILENMQKPLAAIELHVDQTGQLERAGKDLGVVNAIAGCFRFNVVIENKNEKPTNNAYPNNLFCKIRVFGKAGHSGGTPMGKEHRADGLVLMAKIIEYLYSIQEKDFLSLAVEDVAIQEEAINKIPGNVEALIRISGDTKESVNQAYEELSQHIDTLIKNIDTISTIFDKEPMTIERIDQDQSPQSVATLSEHASAAFTINAVHEICNKHRNTQTVGTIGTYTVDDGKVTLGFDIRGIDLAARNKIIDEIKENVIHVTTEKKLPVPEFGKPLPGSSNPAIMDDKLVSLAQKSITEFAIGSYMIMYSSAGHDAQESCAAGIPTVMFFCPSRNGGISHNPKEYSTPDDLEKGSKALAALTITLASK